MSFGPSVQLGVDATLSRWRSPVQIRYGSLEIRCGTPTAERLVLGTSACEFESHPHYSCSDIRPRMHEQRLACLHSNGATSLECEGFARDPAKVEDQVRLLARAFSAIFRTRAQKQLFRVQRGDAVFGLRV